MTIPGTAKASPFYLETARTLAETIRAAALLETNCFVTLGGVYPAAGAYAPGITQMPALKIGDYITITTEGLDVARAGGAIAGPDLELYADATGRVQVVTTPASQVTVARSIDSATGTGTEYVRVRLV